MTLSERIREARGGGDLQAVLDAIPYVRFLGLRVQRQDGDTVGHLPYAPALIGNSHIPALHGGALSALLESTAAFKLLLEVECLPKIVNITIEYLRTARAVDTFARAEIIRQGRRVATVRAVAWQDDPQSPVAAANLHFLLPAA